MMSAPRESLDSLPAATMKETLGAAREGQIDANQLVGIRHNILSRAELAGFESTLQNCNCGSYAGLIWINETTRLQGFHCNQIDPVCGNCNVPHPPFAIRLAIGNGPHGRTLVELPGRRILPDQGGVLECRECRLLDSVAGRLGGSRNYSRDRVRLRQGSRSRFPNPWLPRPGRYQVSRFRSGVSCRNGGVTRI